MRTLLKTVMVVLALSAMPALANAADAAVTKTTTTKTVVHKHHHHHGAKAGKQCATAPMHAVVTDDDNRAEKYASLTSEEKELIKMRAPAPVVKVLPSGKKVAVKHHHHHMVKKIAPVKPTAK